MCTYTHIYTYIHICRLSCVERENVFLTGGCCKKYFKALVLIYVVKVSDKIVFKKYKEK